MLGEEVDDLGEDVGDDVWVLDEGVDEGVGFGFFSEGVVDLLEGEEVVEGGFAALKLGFELGAGVDEVTALNELLADGFELGVFGVFALEGFDEAEGFIEAGVAGEEVGEAEVGFGAEVVEFDGLAVGGFGLEGEAAGVVEGGDGGAELGEGFAGDDIADEAGVGGEALGVPVPEGGVVGDELGGDGGGLVVEFEDEAVGG